MQNSFQTVAEMVIRRYIAQEERLASLKVYFAVKRNDLVLGEGSTQNFIDSICTAVRGAKIHFPTEEEIEAKKQKEERLWQIKKELERKFRIKKNKITKIKTISSNHHRLINSLGKIYVEKKK